MSGALEGLKVLDLSRLLPGPFCSLMLADLGADVLKVEDTGMGDYVRWAPPAYPGVEQSSAGALFLSLNRNKRSIRIDLKSDEGKEVLRRLVKDADVLLESFRPGVLDRLGVGYESLKELNPGLVYCAISGYGQDGPGRDAAGHDMNYLALGGMLGMTGDADGAPIQNAGQVADIGGGALMAAFGILAALRSRDKTGEGAHIDVSMLESLTEWMSFPLYYATDNAPPPTRNGASHATIYPYGPFLAGDGNSVMLGLQNEREWVQFCEVVMQDKALATDPRFNSNSLRHENKALLEPIILKEFAALSAAQVIERLDHAQIANARMNTMADLWAHPQLKARQRWVDIDTPQGKLPALLPPGQSDAFNYTMGASPSVGEHTQHILDELGITWSNPSKP